MKKISMLALLLGLALTGCAHSSKSCCGKDKEQCKIKKEQCELKGKDGKKECCKKGDAHHKDMKKPEAKKDAKK